MMTLKCRDMGKDCNFESRGNTKEEVKKTMMTHVQAEHPDLLNVPEEAKKEMEEKMDSMTKYI